jgi:methionyl aminopeptidase
MISLKSKREIELMRESASRLKVVLEELRKFVRPGITTYDLDKKAEEVIAAQKVTPAFKGYRGYPACICTSPNQVVVHGIPSKKCRLKDGDIISVDMGVVHEGYYSDCARTWPVGSISDDAQKLIAVTKQSLYVGFEKMKAGNRIGDLSNAIQSYVEEQGLAVVRDFVGHGIGRALHEDPQVPNFGRAGKGPKLEVGMVLAIEPMVVEGDFEVDVLQDSWTVVTRDQQLAAHYEDTIAVTENGPVNLTGSQNVKDE